MINIYLRIVSFDFLELVFCFEMFFGGKREKEWAGSVNNDTMVSRAVTVIPFVPDQINAFPRTSASKVAPIYNLIEHSTCKKISADDKRMLYVVYAYIHV